MVKRMRRGTVARRGKNEVILPLVFTNNGKTTSTGGQYAFRDYLKVLTIQPAYLAADDDAKVRMIQNAEERFYKAALPRLLAMDGNEELLRIFKERGILKNMGVVK